MKKISQIENNQLLEYLDGSLTPSEKQSIDEKLKQSSELRTRLEVLQQVHMGLQNTTLVEPSKNFTLSVMSKLNQAPVQTGISPGNSILLLAGVLIAVGIGTLLLSAGVFDGASSIDLNGIVIKNKFIDTTLPSIPFNGKLIVNIIILLNVALALIVFDRAVLRPWFEKRTMNYE
jgi:hypothetical protein